MKVEIELSNKQVEKIKKGLKKEPEMFERIIGFIRVSERREYTNCPVQISILNNTKYGAALGDFNDKTENISGDMLRLRNAKELAQAILDLVAKIEAEK